MTRLLPGIVVGLLFGAGLAVSDMVNPARVLAFLDVAGRWDPTLAYVMGGRWFRQRSAIGSCGE